MVRRDPLKRLNTGLLALAFVLSLFAGRLFQLQGMESSSYARKEKAFLPIPLPAERGTITDAQGNPLATTVEARLIYADPALIPPGSRSSVAQTLATALGLDQATVLKRLDAKPGVHYVVLAHRVRPDKAQMVADLGIPGIASNPEYQRAYPGGSTVAPNLLGFVGSDGSGRSGLEYTLNKVLSGKDGHETVQTSLSGRPIPANQGQIVQPVPGRNVRLTILRDLQWKAQEALDAQVRKVGAQDGSVIVMDTRTSQILAMASSPSYDPNNYWAASPQALADPALQELFEPGSTNKVITAATVMEKGGVTPDTVFTVPSSLNVYGQQIHDAEQHPTRREYFSGVLATSSNVGTMLASKTVSATDLYDYMRAFGYGQASGLGLPGETQGLLPPVNKWSGTQRYTIAFGQGVGVNALQVASVYSTIANRGVRVPPTLVAGSDDGHGNFTPASAPKPQRVISEQTAAELTRMLEGVVSKDGTAPEAEIPGYRVAGKTGTAQRVNPACHCYVGGGYTASFAGFAPADSPQLMVFVVLQNPTKGEYGGTVAAPVFKDVMTFALQARKIPPTGTQSPKVQIYAN
jgi:cell division protein FtsI (penicillin-binding protein 3)